MPKRLYGLKQSIITKIDIVSAEMGIDKQDFVEIAVDEYDNDISKKMVKAQSNIEKLQSLLDLENQKLNNLISLSVRENELIDSLQDQKLVYKENIRRKWDEGDVVGAIEIAKRVGRLLRCSYLDLLPE